MLKSELDELTKQVIGAAIRVHREVGPGVLESTYEACRAYELTDWGSRSSGRKRGPSSIGASGLIVATGLTCSLSGG